MVTRLRHGLVLLEANTDMGNKPLPLQLRAQKSDGTEHTAQWHHSLMIPNYFDVYIYMAMRDTMNIHNC